MSLSCLERHITCVSWNNEGTNLAVGLTGGFIIYSTELLLNEDGWLCEVVRRPIVGGVGNIALHGQSNIVLLVGWEEAYRATVTLYDLAVDGTSREGHLILARVTLPSVVNAVHFHPRLVVVGLTSGLVYFFDHRLRKIESFQVSRSSSSSTTTTTTTRGKGSTMAFGTMLMEQMASGVRFSLLYGVILGPTTGTVRCICYVGEQRVDSSLLQHSLLSLGDTDTNPLEEKILKLHRNEVHCISVTPNGTRALTVSERGTALKFFDVEKGVVICQFFRGTTPNTVHTLALLASSMDVVAVCVSDTGTVHLFYLSTAGTSNRISAEAGTDEPGNNNNLFRVWSNYKNSVGPISRLTIPNDELYDILCRQEAYSKSSYSITLRPIAKKSSCMAHIVQLDFLPNEKALKARLLSVQVDLEETKSMKIVRSFYFPKDDL